MIALTFFLEESFPFGVYDCHISSESLK